MHNPAIDPTKVNPLGHALLYEHIPSYESSIFTTAFFGKHCGDSSDIDWTLPWNDPIIREKGSRILRNMGARIYYAPNVSEANAKRVSRGVMRDEIPVDNDVKLFGNKYEMGDIIMLEQGEGVVYNPAGCGLIFAEYSQASVLTPSLVAHGAWRSFIEDARVLDQTHHAWRMNASVVTNIVRNLATLRHPRGIRVWLRGFIRPEYLRFPLVNSKWAESNTVRLHYIVKHWGNQCVQVDEEGYGLDLAALAAAQFEEMGVHNVDLSNPYVPRGDVWQDGTPSTPRNLFVVVRR